MDDLEVFRGSAAQLDRIVAIQSELSFRALYENQPDYLTVLDEMRSAGFWPASFFQCRTMNRAVSSRPTWCWSGATPPSRAFRTRRRCSSTSAQPSATTALRPDTTAPPMSAYVGGP